MANEEAEIERVLAESKALYVSNKNHQFEPNLLEIGKWRKNSQNLLGANRSRESKGHRKTLIIIISLATRKIKKGTRASISGRCKDARAKRSWSLNCQTIGGTTKTIERERIRRGNQALKRLGTRRAANSRTLVNASGKTRKRSQTSRFVWRKAKEWTTTTKQFTVIVPLGAKAVNFQYLRWYGYSRRW